MNRTLWLIGILLLFFQSVVYAQKDNAVNRLSVYPNLGVDMGGAIPVPLSDKPGGVNGSPKLMPSLGFGIQYCFSEKWNTTFEVNYHILSFSASGLVVSQPFYFDNGTDILYFSGDTYTDVELRFVDFSLMGGYQVSEKWSILLGIYYSKVVEGRFDTEGTNGVLSPEKSITDFAKLPGIANTSYSFSNELSNYDIGFILGYSYKLYPKLNFRGHLGMGVNSIFVPDFDNIDYELYQLRLNLGVSYLIFNGKS